MKKLLRFLYFWLLRGLGIPGLLMVSRRAFSAEDAPRVLVLLPNHLGSMLMSSPAIHALKSSIPNAHITLLVAPEARETALHFMDVDEVLTCTFPDPGSRPFNPLQTLFLLLRESKQWRRGCYDLGLNLRRHCWWGSALCLFARIPVRLGWSMPQAAVFQTTSLPRSLQQHPSEAVLAVTNAGLQALGYPALEQPYKPDRYPMSFAPTSEERSWMEEYLAREKITPETLLIIFHPGTGRPVKQWSASSWSTCATRLFSALADSRPVRFLLTGSQREQMLLEEIVQGTEVPMTITLTMSVGRLAALLERADLVLGVDSGAPHLAIAMETPTVRIFGPTKPETYSAWRRPEKHLAVASSYRCADCQVSSCNWLYLSTDQLPSHPCTKKVPVQAVFEAALRQLPRSLQTRRR